MGEEERRCNDDYWEAVGTNTALVVPMPKKPRPRPASSGGPNDNPSGQGPLQFNTQGIIDGFSNFFSRIGDNGISSTTLRSRPVGRGPPSPFRVLRFGPK